MKFHTLNNIETTKIPRWSIYREI